MAAKGFRISTDPGRNIVRIRLWGFWDVDDAKAYWEEFQRQTGPLSGQKWYILADISEFAPQRVEVNEYYERSMVYSRAHGMVKAANLVSSVVTQMQIARMSGASSLPAYSFFQSELEAVQWLLKD